MSNSNKPAAASDGDSVRVGGATAARAPRWYLWEGGFLAIGQVGGEVPPHAHHAIQIFLALDGTAAIRATGGEWQEGRGLIVRPDAEHSFNARGATGAMLFVDPESSDGTWLQSVLDQDITVAPAARLQGCLGSPQCAPSDTQCPANATKPTQGATDERFNERSLRV